MTMFIMLCELWEKWKFVYIFIFFTSEVPWSTVVIIAFAVAITVVFVDYTTNVMQVVITRIIYHMHI